MRLLDSARRLARRRTFDPTTHGTYEIGRQLIVGSGQSVYDPATFGRYDRATQRVVPLEEGASFWGERFEEMMQVAQDQVRDDPTAIVADRYELVISLLGPGAGLCLDACTASPLDWVAARIRALGFEYQAIDLGGDGEIVRREDVTALTYPDRSVARIISLDTLEHIPDYVAALREFERVLVPGGLLFLHVPTYFFDREDSAPLDPEQDPWGHVRYFSGRELVRNVAAAGLVPRRVHVQLDYGATLCVAGKPR